MSARVYVVTVKDLRGIRRSVEVTASSVFEAGALAVAALREDGWSEPLGPGTTRTIEVSDRQPSRTQSRCNRS